MKFILLVPLMENKMNPRTENNFLLARNIPLPPKIDEATKKRIIIVPFLSSWIRVSSKESDSGKEETCNVK